MKKQLFIIALILAFCCCSSAFAEEPAALGLGMTADGANYTVSVQLSGASGIEMLQFCLKYDAEKLVLQSARAGDLFQGRTLPTFTAKEPGRVYFVWDALSPLEDGILLELYFSTADSASSGSARICFDDDYETFAADAEFNEISLSKAELEIPVSVVQVPASDPVTPAQSDTPTETRPDSDSGRAKNQNRSISVGESITLDQVSDQNLTVSSSDETVASVENGTIVGKSEGVAEITVENDEGTSEIYLVHVKAEETLAELPSEPDDDSQNDGPKEEKPTATAAPVPDSDNRTYGTSAVLPIGILLLVLALVVFFVLRKKNRDQS